MRAVYLLLFVLALLFNAHGQHKIVGSVVNEENKPLEFVTVALKKDSVIIKNTFTDSLGNFMLPHVLPENYNLSFYYLGYKTGQLTLSLNTDTAICMHLSEKSTELKEVVVQDNAGYFERKSDRFVYSVTNTEITKANTIYDVLKQTPLLNVNEGTNNVSLINKPAVIYINGRKSNLSAEALANLLKSTSAENLSRIEIITVPGSQYAIEGKAGVIDIIFKQNKSDHFNGTSRAANTLAFNNSQNVSANINYRKNRVGINTVFYGNVVNSMNIFNVDFQFNENNLLQSNNTRDKQPLTTGGGSMGIDYDINEKHTVGFKADGMYSHQKNAVSTTISRFKTGSQDNTYDSVLQTINANNRVESTINLNANYHFNIDSTGKYFNADVDYIYYANDLANLNETFRVTPDLEIISLRNKFRQQVPQYIRSLSYKIDYQHVFNKDNTLTIGTNGFTTDASNNTVFDDYIDEAYMKDASRSFYYKYHEFTHALYSTYNRAWNKKWQSAIGLRLENTKNKGEVVTTGQGFQNDYHYLLPYLALSYAASEKNQFSYTLSNRVARPAFWELNPFRSYTTSNFYIENNPFLQPQRYYINELTYTFNNKYTCLIDYTYTTKIYDQLQLTDENNNVKMIRLNYGANNNVSASLSTQQTFLNGNMTSNFSITGGWTEYKGNAGYIQINNSYYYFTVSVNSNIILSKAKRWLGVVSAVYNSPTKLPYGYLKSVNTVSLGVRKRYNKWALSVWAQDVLKGNLLKYTIEESRTSSTINTYYNSRSLYVGISYSFGKHDLKLNRSRETSSTDVKNRTQR